MGATVRKRYRSKRDESGQTGTYVQEGSVRVVRMERRNLLPNWDLCCRQLNRLKFEMDEKEEWAGYSVSKRRTAHVFSYIAETPGARAGSFNAATE